jgi:hypothetical protein
VERSRVVRIDAWSCYTMAPLLIEMESRVRQVVNERVDQKELSDWKRVHWKPLFGRRPIESYVSEKTLPVTEVKLVQAAYTEPITSSLAIFQGEPRALLTVASNDCPSERAVLWVIAHEMGHMFTYPSVSNPQNATKMLTAHHDDLPWEKVADEIAYVVTGFTRTKWGREMSTQKRLTVDEIVKAGTDRLMGLLPKRGKEYRTPLEEAYDKYTKAQGERIHWEESVKLAHFLEKMADSSPEPLSPQKREMIRETERAAAEARKEEKIAEKWYKKLQKAC